MLAGHLMEEVLVLFRVPGVRRVLRIPSVDLVLIDAGPGTVFAHPNRQVRTGAVEVIGPRTEVIGTPVVPAIVLVEAGVVGQVVNGLVVRQVRGCRRRSRR